MTHYFKIPAIHSNLIQIFHFIGGQRAMNEYFISYTHMLGQGLEVIWVRMIQCKTGKHADSFLSYCIYARIKSYHVFYTDINVQ